MQGGDKSNQKVPDFTQLTAADMMEKEVQCGHRQTKGDVLGSLMIEGFGGVPIVDDHLRLIGIVTEFDLLSALDQGRKLADLTAQEIMTDEVVQISPHTEMRTLIYILQTNHLIRVPVVDGDGKLIGIVARRDVVRGYLNSNPQ
jgi:CBS-domain-containing membrane protein